MPNPFADIFSNKTEYKTTPPVTRPAIGRKQFRQETVSQEQNPFADIFSPTQQPLTQEQPIQEPITGEPSIGEALYTGLFNIAGGAYGAVKFTGDLLYSLGAIPQNIIARTFDIPSMEANPRKFRETFPFLKKIEEIALPSAQVLAEAQKHSVSRHFDSDIFGYLKQGDIGNAGKLLGYQVLENLPQQIEIIGLSLLTGNPTLGAGVLSAQATGQKYEALQKKKDMPDLIRFENALSTGLVEYLTENYLGTVPILRRLMAQNKAGFKGGLKSALKVFVRESGRAFREEGLEEGVAGISENMIDILTDNRDESGRLPGLFDGVVDQTLVGAFSGGFMGGGGSAINIVSSQSDLHKSLTTETGFARIRKAKGQVVRPAKGKKPVSLVSEAKKYKTADVTVFPTGKENVLAEIKEAIKKAPGTLHLGDKNQTIEAYEKENLLNRDNPTWFQKDPIKTDPKTIGFKIDGGLNIINDKAALWEIYQKVKATAPKLPAPPKPKKISVPKGKGREAIVEGFKKDIVVFEKKIDRLEREEMGIEYADLTPKQKKDRRELIKKDIAYFKESLKAAKENIRFKGIKPTVKPVTPKVPVKPITEESIKEKFFKGEKLTDDDKKFMAKEKVKTDKIFVLSPKEASKLPDKDFDTWGNTRARNVYLGTDGLKIATELHEAFLLKGDVDHAITVRKKIDFLQTEDPEGNFLPKNEAENKIVDKKLKELIINENEFKAHKEVKPEVKPTVAETVDLGSTHAEKKGIPPDEMVTVYRASEKGDKIKSGNFVTTSREQARFYAQDIVGQRGGAKATIVTQKVRAGDIRLKKSQEAIGVDDAFIYTPRIEKVKPKVDVEQKEFLKEQKEFIKEELLQEKERKAEAREAKERLLAPIPQKQVASLVERIEKKTLREGKQIGRKEARQRIYLGLKAKSIAVKEVKQTLKDYTQEHLSGADRDKILRGLDKVTTKHQLLRRLQMVDAIEAKRARQVSVSSLKKTVGKIDFKRLRPEFKGTIEKLANSIDLVNRQDRTIDRLNRMVDYIKRNPDHNIPQEQLNRLDILARTPQKNLTVEDIDLIKNSIQHLVHLQNLKNKIIIKRKVRDFKEIKDKAIANVQKKKTPITDPRKGIQTSGLAKLWTTESMNTELMSWMFDGAQKNDANHEVFYGNIDEGVTEQLRFSHEAEDFFSKKVGDIPLSWSEKFNKKEADVDYHDYALNSGKKIKLTKGERISVYLHSLNGDNLRHILDGGIRLKTNPNILYKITTEDLANITKDVTGKELEVAEAIHEYYNTVQNKKLNEISMKLNGWEIATEENYFPIDIYGIDVPQNYLLKGEVLPNNMKAFTRFTLEDMGMLKARTKGSNPLVLDDTFSVTNKSIQKASAYYGLAAPLRTAKALLNAPDFQSTLTNTYGPHYWVNLNEYIRAIEGEALALDNFEKLTTEWINKLDTAVLGLNPFVMLKQPVSFMAAGTEIDIKYLEKALISLPEKTEVMSKYSPQLRDRFKGNVSREMGELGKVGQTRKFWTHKEFLNQKIMAGIKNFDYQAIGRIWKAVEFETNTLHPGLKGDERMKHIAARTEEVVRLTQPTFHIKDRSAIGRSPRVFTRLITKYSSQRNKNYMMLIRNTAKYNNSQKTTADKKSFFKSLSILLVLMPLLIMGIDELRNLAYKRKRPKREKEHFLLEYINNLLGQVYFVAPLVRSMASKIERGTFAGYDVSDVFTSTINRGLDSMANMAIAIRQAVEQERYKSGDKKGTLKWDNTALRATDQAVSTVAKLKFGLPYDTVKKLITSPFKWLAPEKKKKAKTIRPALGRRIRPVRRAKLKRPARGQRRR